MSCSSATFPAAARGPLSPSWIKSSTPPQRAPPQEQPLNGASCMDKPNPSNNDGIAKLAEFWGRSSNSAAVVGCQNAFEFRKFT